MTKNHIFIGAAIVAIAGIGVFAVLRPKIQPGVCINNGRQFDAATLERMQKQDALVLSLVPLGTTFSKAVAVLGSDYSTSKTNAQESFYASFNCLLPGMTNQSSVTFLVSSNVIVWTGYIMTGYPMGLPKPPDNYVPRN
jgi:hypothetical protein